MTQTLDHPNPFIGIGAGRAGTTWLHQQLRRHPEIWMPPIKELRYFKLVENAAQLGTVRAHWIDHLARKLDRLANGPPSGVNAAQIGDLRWMRRLTFTGELTDAWYASLFDGAGKCAAAGEISPAYSYLSEAGFDHLRRVVPNGRLLYILREPVAHAWSTLCHDARVANNSAIRSRDHAEKRLASPNGRAAFTYAPVIDRARAVFGADRLKILFYEDLVADPLAFLAEICVWLGVPPDPAHFPDAGTVVNAGQGEAMPADLADYLADALKDVPAAVRERAGRVPSAWCAEGRS